jgi:hypothetical protein
MTLIGKMLAFLNLIVGLAILAWSVSIYTQRPGWFDPVPDGVSPGNHPVTFAQLKADIDALGRTAAAASGNWGAQLKALQQVEAERADRQRGYAERLGWARTGNPNSKDKDGNKDGAAFFAPVFDSSTGLLDLNNLGPAILGPDNLPLQGVDTLGKTIAKDTALIVKYAKEIDDQRKVFDKLSIVVLATEERLRRMAEIRDAVQAEKFYLDTFEVNVYEERETVLRRKRQLMQRLAGLK